MFSPQPRTPKKNLRGGRRPKKPKQRQGIGERHSPQKSQWEHSRDQMMVVDGGKRSHSGTTIWKNLEAAKRRQNSIRRRVRRYSRNDDDSDYSDSHSSDNNSYSYGLGNNNNDSDSDEYDDDFDLGMHQENGKVQQHIQGTPETFSSLHSKSSAKKKKTEAQTSPNNSRHKRPMGISTVYPSMKGFAENRNDDKAPALTSEEAIRMVMQRHSYISDSEESEEEKSLGTKTPERETSYSTNETSANTTTTHTDDEHKENNRSHTGKRVLVLKHKKPREDTHPITSKNKKYHEKKPSQQNRNTKNLSITSKSKTNQTKQQQTPQPRVPTKSAEKQHVCSSNNVDKSAEFDVPLSLQSSVLKRAKDIVGEDEKNAKQRDANGGYDHASNRSAQRSRVKQPSKSRQGIPNDDRAVISDKNSQEEVHSVDASTKGGESNNGKDDSSDEDDSEYDDNFFQIDGDTAKTMPQNPLGNRGANSEPDKGRIDNDSEATGPESSIEDVDSTEPACSDDDEEYWAHFSFKTAKTSRSTSRHSRASANQAWVKAMQQDDDIDFFDAIQNASESNRERSVKLSDEPPHVIGEDDDSDGEGWTEKLTSFVGSTIGALATGSKDSDEDSKRGDRGAHAPASDRSMGSSSTKTTTTTTTTTTGRSRNTPRFPSDKNKKVPSRELEIIRKCQEQMENQWREVERREREAAANTRENILLRRQEEEARAPIRREVMAYRKMMEGMGKGEKLAPLDSKEAAQEYDDRLALGKTLKEQERKMRMNELTLRKMDMEDRKVDADEQSESMCARCCVIS